MPPLASAAISQATSFLNQQFSRGSDVPYDPQLQRLIRQHLLDLVGVSGALWGQGRCNMPGLHCCKAWISGSRAATRRPSAVGQTRLGDRHRSLAGTAVQDIPSLTLKREQYTDNYGRWAERAAAPCGRARACMGTCCKAGSLPWPDFLATGLPTRLQLPSFLPQTWLHTPFAHLQSRESIYTTTRQRLLCLPLTDRTNPDN